MTSIATVHYFIADLGSKVGGIATIYQPYLFDHYTGIYSNSNKNPGSGTVPGVIDVAFGVVQFYLGSHEPPASAFRPIAYTTTGHSQLANPQYAYDGSGDAPETTTAATGRSGYVSNSIIYSFSNSAPGLRNPVISITISATTQFMDGMDTDVISDQCKGTAGSGVVVEISLDGTSWGPLFSITDSGSCSGTETISLPDLAVSSVLVRITCYGQSVTPTYIPGHKSTIKQLQAQATLSIFDIYLFG